MEKIAVIGIGRLGLCLALNIEQCGYSVVGIDISEDYVTSINTRTFTSSEPQVNDYLNNTRHFAATTQLREILNNGYKAIFIVLPTPSLPGGEFSHHYIDTVIEQLTAFGKQETLTHLVINSTCMPGYCDSVKNKLLALNYTITYNPEFIAQGSIIHDQQYPDQVLIGEADPLAGDVVESIYKKLCKSTPRFCRMSLISAEITKLATNCFLTTKISFANAIGDIAAQLGAEPEKILEAIGADSRIGNKYFKYGFGYGGPCFPRDNKAFVKFASNHQYQMLISESTDRANEMHNHFLIEQWLKEYVENQEVIFDSVTYKKGTDILEESQQLRLAVALAKAGRKVIIKENKTVIKSLIDLYSNLFIYQVNES